MKFKPLEEKDVPKLMYRNNFETLFCLGDVMMYGEEDTKKWLKNLGGTSKRWGIYINHPNKMYLDNQPFEELVGVIRLDRLDSGNRTIMVGMDIFSEFQGKGYAKQAYKILLDYLFKQYYVHMAYLEVISTNTRAINLYEKLGFKQTGSLPEAIFRDGQRLDYLIYSLLARDWQKEI